MAVFVPIYPGQDIQAAVTASTGSTRFLIKTGIHRLSTFIVPKTGNEFHGEAGAILNGSQDITSSFVPSGGKWVATGMTMENPILGQECADATDTCKYPNDVYFDGAVLTREVSAAAVGPGEFFFDLAADTITIGDDPGCCHVVEVAVATRAFKGFTTGVTNVLIRGLIVEKFATETSIGAINGRVGWTIENCEVRLNHSIGIQGQTIRNNYTHHNGQYGIGGSGDALLIEGNEISYNNYAGYHDGYAGGTKFTAGDGLIARNNYVHHNAGGAGLWTDGDNINVLYEDNTVTDNAGSGIDHEIGWDAIIRNNTLLNNNTADPGGSIWNGGNILLNASQNVEIHGNTIQGKNGITIVDTGTRGTSPLFGPRIAQNNNVHDNTIRLVVGEFTGRAGDATDPAKNNTFTSNDYFLTDLSAGYFDSTAITTTAWQALGQDTTAGGATFTLWVP
jgi:parallel beta-helix repeat protein